MPGKKKKISITSERHEILVVRSLEPDTLNGFCGECRTEREMLMLDSAVSLFDIRTKRLIELVQSGRVHTIETSDGHMLVCAWSLARMKGD